MKSIIFAIIVAATPLLALAQTNFQNLNFESANLSSTPPPFPSLVPIGSALPGWNADVGGSAQTQVYQDSFGHGLAEVDVFGPSYAAADPTFSGGNPGVIDGKFSVLLQAGLLNDGITPENVSLDQTGAIPPNAESLQFKAWQSYDSLFTISFNGNILSPVILGTGANYTLYGVEIAPYAGQTGQIDFTAHYVNPGESWLGLDDINFSANSVPEPSIGLLGALGGAAFALSKKLRQR